MRRAPSLAVLGGRPRLSETLPVGQFYWPDWQRYEDATRGIFSRRYYTAQRFAGPLVVQFQQRLQQFLGVKHAIVVRNATNGLMIVAHTLGLRGKVIVPSWTHISTVQSLLWSGCEPVFCDIEPDSQQMSIDSVRCVIESGAINGILGAHLWGNALPVAELEMLANEYRLPFYCDAAHAFGCRVGERAVGTFGQAEVFSFHASNILSTAEGGCITTNDDALAAKLRAMRGDHVPGGGVSMQSATARMSEIQAAIGMALLDDFERHRRSNEEQHRRYVQLLQAVPGIKILMPSAATVSNFQNCVGIVDSAKFGLTRDQLLTVLRAENVAATADFHPPCHRVDSISKNASRLAELENTERAAESTFQLPIGAQVTADHIDRICDIVHEANIHSETVRTTLARLAAS
jgi:dTDP-4-amino-4,6-dideoxygalactose transaminase